MKASSWVLVLLAATVLAGEQPAQPSVQVKPVEKAAAPAAKPAAPAATPAPAQPEVKPDPRSSDPQAEQVVEAYLKALGGREALAAIQDRYEKFEVARHSTTGKTPAIFERYQKRPNLVREDWDMEVMVGDQKLQVTQTYNGKEAWTKMMGYVARLEGQMIYMLVWDKYIDDFFMNWKQDGYSLRFRSADGEVNKEPCNVIDCYNANGTQEGRYFFSKKENLLLKKQWRSDEQGGPVRSELYFTAYRSVSNPKAPDKPIRFSFRREQLAEGDLTMEREYVEVRLNSGLADQIFGRPEGPLFPEDGRVGAKKEEGKEGEQPEKKQPPWAGKKRIVPKTEPGEGTKPAAETPQPAPKPPEGTPPAAK
jgi:hypothetical protein